MRQFNERAAGVDETVVLCVSADLPFAQGRFCQAEGTADVYPRMGPTMEWDTAAGSAIAEAVGLKVIAQDTAGPLKYNKENLLNPYFLVRK